MLLHSTTLCSWREHLPKVLLVSNPFAEGTTAGLGRITMQDYSTAHTFHYRWFVLWERTPSSQKSDLRLVMVLFPTHLLKEQLQVLVVSLLIATDTTEELELTTSCNSDITYFFNKETLTGLFFCASMYRYYTNTNMKITEKFEIVSFITDPVSARINS